MRRVAAEKLAQPIDANLGGVSERLRQREP